MADSDPSGALSGLLATLPNLEEAFEPILSKGWNEAVKDLEPLDRAKLDVLMAYAINDLVWMYLRVKGIDPASHEVSTELERIKTYYGKIKAAEQPQTIPIQRIDKAAANRFVSAAIPKSQREAPASTSGQALVQDQARRVLEEQESLERMGMDNRFRFVAGEAETLSSSDEDEDEDKDEDTESGEEQPGPQHKFFDDEPEAIPPNDGADDVQIPETNEPKSKRRRKRAEDFV